MTTHVLIVNRGPEKIKLSKPNKWEGGESYMEELAILRPGEYKDLTVYRNQYGPINVEEV